MNRRKYQRPEVYLWKGKSKVKYWKGEWRAKVTGKDKPIHRASTWLCQDFSKSEAQAALDKLVREETDGPPVPDDGLTVQRFFAEVYWPSKSLRIKPNTRHTYQAAWRRHVQPGIGPLHMNLVNKAAVDAVLNKMALADLSESTLENTLYLMKGMFGEAADDGYILKDPTRRIEIPLARPAIPTRPLSEEEVIRLFEGLSGRDYIFWRVLGLTGCRVSEVLALGKRDVVYGELTAIKVTKSAYNGKPDTTKNKRSRLVPIPARLAEEIAAYAASVESDLLFPNAVGNMMQRSGRVVQGMLASARAASGVPDLTFRQCRTTVATHWDGDYKDLQESLGHQSIDVTLSSYRKAQLERQQTTMERLEARFTGKLLAIPKKVG